MSELIVSRQKKKFYVYHLILLLLLNIRKISEKVSRESCAVSWKQKYRNNSSISLQAVTEIGMSTLLS